MTVETSGWTSAGLVVPTLQDWVAYVVATMNERMGITIPQTPDSPLYNVALAVADACERATELMIAVVDGLDPVNATGEALDVIARFNGFARLAAASSTVPVELTGTSGTVVPAGARFTAGGVTWVLDSAVTITSAPGSGTCTCDQTGPVDLASATVLTPALSHSGLTSIETTDDASPGRDRETDAALRARVFAARFLLGRGTEDAIRAALLEVVGVEHAAVVSNRTGDVDGAGRAPHSFEAVILPNTVSADLIGAVLLEQQPAGVETHGTETLSVTDDSGITRTLRWNWGSEVSVSIRATSVTVSADAPDDWSTQITDAWTALVAALRMGDTLRYIRVYGVFSGFPWVTGGTVQTKRGAGSWGTADITAAYNELLVAATVTASA